MATEFLEADSKVKALPVAEQVSVMGLINDMRIMSENLGSAGAHSARSAKHLAGMANAAAMRVTGEVGKEAADDTALSRFSRLQDAAQKAASVPIDIIHASRGQTLQQPPAPPPEALPRGNSQETLRVYEDFVNGKGS